MPDPYPACPLSPALPHARPGFTDQTRGRQCGIIRRHAAPAATPPPPKEPHMSKGMDQKKQSKKEPSKTMKEKKAEKKEKKRAKG